MRDERASAYDQLARQGTATPSKSSADGASRSAGRGRPSTSADSWTDEEGEILVEKIVTPPTSGGKSSSSKRKRRGSGSRTPPSPRPGSRGGYQRDHHRPAYQDRYRPPSRDGGGFFPSDRGNGGGYRGRGSFQPFRGRGRGLYNRPDHNPDSRPYYTADSDEQRRLWAKLERELSVLEDTLERKRQFYVKRPEDHPHYADEWKAFWQRRYLELKAEGKDPAGYDFKPEWILFWHGRMKELDRLEVATKKTELKRKYGLTGDSGGGAPSRSSARPSLDRDDRIGSIDRRDIAKNPSPPLVQPATVPDEVELISSPEVFTVEEKIEAPVDLMSVLRMLAALEDSLGSLGPNVTKLLSQALAAERSRPGSAAQIQRSSSCIDLLDTCKEKLKGLLVMGILEGVKVGAARTVVDKIERLLQATVPEPEAELPPVERPEVTKAKHLAAVLLQQGKANISDHELQQYLLAASTAPGSMAGQQFPPPSATAPTMDTATLIANLQAAGLLPIKTDDVPPAPQPIAAVADPFDQFSPEELKMLIGNYRTLTPSQQRDLVNYLRQLEAKHPPEPVRRPPSAGPVDTKRPTSPFSLKYGRFENDVNPTAPDPLPCRFPALMKLTGLTPDDLKGSGLPLNEIDPFPPPPAASAGPSWSKGGANPVVMQVNPLPRADGQSTTIPPAGLHSILKKPAPPPDTSNPWAMQPHSSPAQPRPSFPGASPQGGRPAPNHNSWPSPSFHQNNSVNHHSLDPRQHPSRPAGQYPMDPRSVGYRSYLPPRGPPVESRVPVTIPTSPLQRPPLGQQHFDNAPTRYPPLGGAFQGGRGRYH